MNKPNTRRRSSGRPPVSRDGDAKRTLIGVAERLFAEQGYAATSVRDIAELAGLNPALVSYHFGGKLGLLEAVFTAALEPMASALGELNETGSASPAQLLGLLQKLASLHPHMLPLLVREAMLPGGTMHEVFAQRFAPRLGGLFPALLRGEQERGALDADADPEALTMLLISMAVFPHIAANMAERVIGLSLKEGGAERLEAQSLRLLQRGAGP